ncbi:MAG: rRNA synthase [Thermoanaerobaculia bacterium]|jgi:23S rRNA pseudouridine1911/1915/1917 synthase|nr:rRNA synthase [Thermoanaerobaculia bacterium]
MNVTFVGQDNGERLDRALAAHLPDHSRSFIARLIENGRVTLDGRVAVRPSVRVAAGETAVLDIPPSLPIAAVSQEMPLRVIFEDADLIVVDKPAGLVVHPSAGHADQTLVNALLFHVQDLSGIGGALRPGIVHRLDKDTSGVMVIAKNDAAHRKLSAAWGTERVRKEYIAIVYGTPQKPQGTIDTPIARDPHNRKRMAIVAGGRRAVTDYGVIETLRHASVLRCVLHTGRTHQIRVHLKSLGHPIIGDPVYSGPQWRGIPDKRLQKAIASFERQALHAAVLVIPHPKTDKELTFSAGLPGDMVSLIDVLR